MTALLILCAVYCTVRGAWVTAAEIVDLVAFFARGLR